MVRILFCQSAQQIHSRPDLGQSLWWIQEDRGFRLFGIAECAVEAYYAAQQIG